MSDDTEQVAAPTTRDEWRAALREAAHAIMSAQPRPSRAGNLAGALTACAGGRSYNHGDVTHIPSGNRAVKYITGKSAAERLAAQLRSLQLPGIDQISTVPGGEGERTTLILTPFPIPES